MLAEMKIRQRLQAMGGGLLARDRYIPVPARRG